MSTEDQSADDARGLRTFRHVLSLPGALRFTSAGFMTRLPLATAGLAIMFLAVEHIGSYAIGGAIVAAYSIARAVAAPYLGKLIDRWGQARVMSRAVALQLVFLFLLTAGIILGWHLAVLIVLAVVAGVGTGSPPALVRARWSNLLGGSRAVTTAFAWESIVEETAFIIGPIVVAVLVTIAPSVTGIAFAAAGLAIGSLALYTQRSTEPALVPRAGSDGAALTARARNVIVLAAVLYFCVAVTIGSLDVYAVALAQSAGAPWAAGILIGALAAGSLVSAFVYGSIEWRRSPQGRLVGVALLFAVAASPLAFIDGIALSGVAVAVIGVSVSAALTTANLAVREAAPAGRLTEALTWMTTAMGLGVSAGSALSGLLIDAVSVHAGAYPVTASAILAIAAIAVGLPLLRKAHAQGAVVS